MDKQCNIIKDILDHCPDISEKEKQEIIFDWVANNAEYYRWARNRKEHKGQLNTIKIDFFGQF